MGASQLLSTAVWSGAAAWFAAAIPRSLARGEFKSGGTVYGRSDRPAVFWLSMGLLALGSAYFAWRAVLAWRGDGSAPGTSGVVFLFAALAAFEALKRAAAAVRGLPPGPRARLRQAAAAVAWTGVAVYGVVLFRALDRSTPWSLATPYARTVAPVVGSVRASLGDEAERGLRDVRIDRQSGFVCGEAGRPDRSRRFFGRAGSFGARVRLDDSSPGFQAAYRRACGGEGYVPSQA